MTPETEAQLRELLAEHKEAKARIESEIARLTSELEWRNDFDRRIVAVMERLASESDPADWWKTRGCASWEWKLRATRKFSPRSRKQTAN
jgi:hypothetical protein